MSSTEYIATPKSEHFSTDPVRTGHTPCVCCGKGVSDTNKRAIRVNLAKGGTHLAAASLGTVDGDLGEFPVGSECAKRVPAAFSLGKWA